MSNLIEFICSDEAYEKHFPPLPAKKLLPDWYKELPLESSPESMDARDYMQDLEKTSNFTIKACLPVADYLTSGYIIRNPIDIIITPETVENKKGWWWFAKHSDAKIHLHPHHQCPVEIEGMKHVYCKISNPWRIKTPPGYSCLFFQPEFFFEKNFKLFPSIVDTDEYEYTINFPGIVLAKDSFVLEAGTPLMVVFPFKRESWSHKVSVQKEFKINPVVFYLKRGYKKLFHKQKNYL